MYLNDYDINTIVHFLSSQCEHHVKKTTAI